MATCRGGLIANTALARKLAAWFWRVMVEGDEYIFSLREALQHQESVVGYAQAGVTMKSSPVSPEMCGM